MAVGKRCSMRQRGPRRADIWLGRLPPLFDDPGVVSVGFWPTLSVKRKSPLAPSLGEVGFGEEEKRAAPEARPQWAVVSRE